MLTQRQLQLLRFVHEHMDKHGICPSFEEMRAALGLRSKSGIHRLVSGLEERGFIRRLAYRARAVEILKLPPVGSGDRDKGVPRLVDDQAGGLREEAARDFGKASEPVLFGDALVPASAFASEEPGRDLVGCREAASNILRGNFRGRSHRPSDIDGGSVSLPLYGRIAAGTPIEAFADNETVIQVPNLLMGDGEHYVVQVAGDSMIEAGVVDGDYVVIQRCDTAENGTIVVALVEGREVTLKRIRRRGASIALEPANPNYEIRIFGPHQVKVQGRLVGLLRRY
ncbi:MAG: transcriptional repressor LexA [Geminicoccaceae bacterium]|nr:transcriptional repressor LexA [Geminicoccaceae bacterium]